jgi:hypothetical protein
MADLIPASRLSPNGWRPGVNVGVRGGIGQYQSRPVTVNFSSPLPGTTRSVCRHAESVLATSSYGTSNLTVNEGSLLTVGNVVSIPGVIRKIEFTINGPATGDGNLTVRINNENFVVPVVNGQSTASVASSIANYLPGYKPPTQYGGSNPYQLGANQYILGFYFRDFTIDLDPGATNLDFGTTGCSGSMYAVPTPETYVSDILSINGNIVGVETPVGTNFTSQAMSIDNASVIQYGLDLLNENETAFLPVGLYILSDGVGVDSKRTFRGAGTFVESKSTNTVGLGTKVFTVRAGMGYVPGVGVRIERRKLTAGNIEWADPIFMQGLVVSYVGTTLTVNVTKADGEFVGYEYSDWKVSLTMLLYDGGGSAVGISSGGTVDGNPWHTIIGSPVTGAEYITLGSGEGANYSAGRLARISLKNTNTAAQLAEPGFVNDPVISTKGYEWMRSQTVEIREVNGDTLRIAPPLFYDLPVSLAPHIQINNQIPKREAGVEFLSVRGRSSATEPMVKIYGGVDCWFYGVESELPLTRAAGMVESVYCEYNRCWIGWARNATFYEGNQAGILVGYTGCCLVAHCIFEFVFMGVQINAGSNGFAVLHTYVDDGLNFNHGAHNTYVLVEGCVFDGVISDGYHGSSSRETVFRNYAFGDTFGIDSPTPNAKGSIIMCRFNRRANLVGNVLGTPGAPGTAGQGDGEIILGRPGMGTSEFEGYVTPSAGACWPELTTGYWGTVQNRVSDNSCELLMTADAGLMPGINPIDYGSQLLGVLWSDGSSQPAGVYGLGALRGGMKILAVNGNVWSIGATEPGPALPPNGSTVCIWPGAYGFNQWDNDVALSALRAGNYMVTGATGAQESIPEGTTIPLSLAYPNGAPADWPAGFAWPPVQPDNPTFSKAIIPAGALLTNGDGPLPGDTPAAPSVCALRSARAPRYAIPATP